MIFNLKATPRKTIRKSDLHTLRAGGMIPAVIYGPKMESISVSIPKGILPKCIKRVLQKLVSGILN